MLIPFAFLLSTAAIALDAPRELGQVRWTRDLEAAFSESREAGKPVFLLFQEVPG